MYDDIWTICLFHMRYMYCVAMTEYGPYMIIYTWLFLVCFVVNILIGTRCVITGKINQQLGGLRPPKPSCFARGLRPQTPCETRVLRPPDLLQLESLFHCVFEPYVFCENFETYIHTYTSGSSNIHTYTLAPYLGFQKYPPSQLEKKWTGLLQKSFFQCVFEP